MNDTGNRPRIVFFPDYTVSNPYQSLLYASISDTYEAAPGSIHTALWEQSQAALDETVAFHLHWEDAIYKHASVGSQAKVIELFFKTLETFKRRGGALIWTVHNKQPHDLADKSLHREVCRRVAGLADAVHLHSPGAAEQVIEPFKINPQSVKLIPHGNYLPILQSNYNKHSAREELKFPHSKRLFVLFGRMLGYKGANDLIEAYQELNDPNLLAWIIGKQKERVSNQRPDGRPVDGITIIDKFLSQEDLSLRITASDFVVLPYRDSLTSGSIIHSFSHGRAVIVPRLPAFDGLVSERNAILYKPNDQGSLRSAMKRAAGLDNAMIDQYGQGALAEARNRDWAQIGTMFANMFDACRTANPNAG